MICCYFKLKTDVLTIKFSSGRSRTIFLAHVGFFNKTKAPYAYQKTYTPFSYNIMTLSAGYKVTDNTLSWDYRNDWSHTSLPHFPLFQLHGDWLSGACVVADNQ